MINFVDYFFLKDLKLNYGVSTFSNVGDELIFPVPEGGFSNYLYPRRHIIFNGSFRIDWMVGGTVLGLYHIFTEQDKQDLLVFPYKNQPCDAIKITSLEPNSSYLCVVALLEKENKIIDESFILDANISYTLQRGRLYVCNKQLSINGVINPPLKPFACVYNELVIIPDVNCKLASFYSVSSL